MKVSLIKNSNNHNGYGIIKGFGVEVFEIDNPENIDKKIEELSQNKYETIIIPNDLASFSQNIINEYSNNKKTNIIIIPTKHKNE